MSTVNVAGVEVDTRHWIGGQRAASAAAFTDLSPIDEQPLAELIVSGSASFEAGPAWRGDATLELFESPTEELARLEVREIIGGYYRQVGVTWDGGQVLEP